MTWRIATHPNRPASAPEVIYQMCMDDVVEAHRVLDAIDEMRAAAREERE